MGIESVVQSIHLELRYDESTIHPMHRFVCESPHVEREVLLEGRRVADGRTMLFFVEGDRERYESILGRRPDLDEFDITPADDGFYVWVRAENREADLPLIDAFEQDTLVVVPPVEFRSDRTARFTVVGSGADLRSILDSLPDGVDATVHRLGDPTGIDDDGVTDRQREALRAAWDLGYFEIPRTGSIDDVAAELDCATSTASDLLRRATATLTGNALGEH